MRSTQRFGIVVLVVGVILAGIGLLVGALTHNDCGSVLAPTHTNGLNLATIFAQNLCDQTLSGPTGAMWTLIVIGIILVLAGTVMAVVRSERADAESTL